MGWGALRARPDGRGGLYVAAAAAAGGSLGLAAALWAATPAAAAAPAGIGGASAQRIQAVGAGPAKGQAGEEPGITLLRAASRHVAGAPEFTRAELAAHTTPERGIWVSYGESVFDITEFVKQHPGGAKRYLYSATLYVIAGSRPLRRRCSRLVRICRNQAVMFRLHRRIMLAAGKGLEPFWNIYQQHFGEGAAEGVAAHLDRMRVGNLVPSAAELAEQDAAVAADDPFAREPAGRHPSLKVWSKRAFNAESPTNLIGDTWVTPTEIFYVRHHHPVPDIDADSYRLTVRGPGLERELKLSMANLKELFPKREVVVTTQCGGNRRSGMNAVKKTMGISWGVGAISTATWGGVWLKDVLRLAGRPAPRPARLRAACHGCAGLRWRGGRQGWRTRRPLSAPG
jgi:sulfite oxidase